MFRLSLTRDNTNIISTQYTTAAILYSVVLRLSNPPDVCSAENYTIL